jgi:hypothetical protein
MMDPLRTLLRRHRARWPAVAGAAMLLASALLWLFVVRPMDSDNDRLLRSLSEASRRPQGGPRAGEGPIAQMRLYESRLPPLGTSADWAGRIYRIGLANGLLLPSGDYRLESKADERVLRYRMTLPVSGSYPQVRDFVLEVLRDVPSAALDDIQLRREAGGARVEARIRLSLFFQPS